MLLHCFSTNKNKLFHITHAAFKTIESLTSLISIRAIKHVTLTITHDPCCHLTDFPHNSNKDAEACL